MVQIWNVMQWILRFIYVWLESHLFCPADFLVDILTTSSFCLHSFFRRNSIVRWWHVSQLAFPVNFCHLLQVEQKNALLYISTKSMDDIMQNDYYLAHSSMVAALYSIKLCCNNSPFIIRTNFFFLRVSKEGRLHILVSYSRHCRLPVHCNHF